MSAQAELPESTAAIAVYMRVSGDEQKRQGTIENQRNVLTRYLDAQGVAPYGWYQDEAVSGYFVPFPQRPDAMRLIADVRAGHVNTILVRKLDRFGRNAREILNAVHDLEQAGARLISLKEAVDTRTSAGRFFLTVLAGVAELERDVIVERAQEGNTRRLEETAWMGGRAPIGLRVEGRKRDARLVINDIVDPASGYSEVDVVRLGWHLLVEQDWTVERICEHLDTLGIAPRNGRPGAHWSSGVVYRMLADVHNIYAGMRTYRTKDGGVHSHPVPAILTQQQIEQARAVLARHRTQGEPRPASASNATAEAYLLRGMLRCGQCGQNYTTHWTRRTSGPDDGMVWRYYICSTRHLRHNYFKRHSAAVLAGAVPLDCDAPGVDAGSAERQIWADVEGFIREPAEVLTLLAAQWHATTAQQEKQRAQLAELQRTFDALQQQRDDILALYRRGRISERDLDRQLDAIAEEEASYTSDRETLAAALQDASEGAGRLETARTLLQQLHARLDTEPLTAAMKRDMLKALISEIRVESREVGISVRGRVKRRAVLHVWYRFHPRADGEDAQAPASQHIRHIDLSAR